MPKLGHQEMISRNVGVETSEQDQLISKRLDHIEKLLKVLFAAHRKHFPSVTIGIKGNTDNKGNIQYYIYMANDAVKLFSETFTTRLISLISEYGFKYNHRPEHLLERNVIGITFLDKIEDLEKLAATDY